MEEVETEERDIAAPDGRRYGGWYVDVDGLWMHVGLCIYEIAEESDGADKVTGGSSSSMAVKQSLLGGCFHVGK